MVEQTEYTYDVFISYSHHDGEWVRNWLLPRLERAGLRVCIDFRDFEVGVPSLVNMEWAVERSRKTLLVLTPNWVKSEWTTFEALLVQTDDPSGLRRRTLPLMLEKCKLPKRIDMLTYADFTRPDQRESQLERIFDAIGDGVALTRAVEVSDTTEQAATSPGTGEDPQYLRKLLATKRRRLQALELQEAQFGISAPPHVTIEIEDLRREIAELEAQLK